MSGLVGIDVGGTFTDLYYTSGESGAGDRVLKVPSTPDDPSRGLIDALDAAGIDPAALEVILHGTTIATNAVIERRGAKAALVTSRGFRDILELGRRDRQSMYGMTGVQQPLIPRRMRWEIDERMLRTGAIERPLDEAAMTELAQALAGEDLDAVVVAFLHSYANSEHERRAADILREANPDWEIVVSSDVVREYYEFERTSTAVVQGYLQPLVGRYVRNLSAKLRECGFSRQAMVMQSNGGLIPLEQLANRAAFIVRSGPAAGVMAAVQIARQAGFDNVITGDMGGTSYDVAVVIDGEPEIAETTQLDFRVPLQLPMIEVNTIGAGGGSIASVDRGGILQVGPRSAGAVPGPACFGRGGTAPTVADANAVLGRINAERPIGLRHLDRLDIEAARAAIGRLGDDLGLGIEETAEAILTVVNHTMARRTRVLTVEKGHDPRSFAQVTFGGAGPLHGAAIMREVGIRVMLLPPYPGVLCAQGCALADTRYDLSQTIEAPIRSLDPKRIRQIMEDQRAAGLAELERSTVPLERSVVGHAAKMAYKGQIHTLRVPVEPDWDVDRMIAAFEETYREEYGNTLGDIPVTLVGLTATAEGIRKKPDLSDDRESIEGTPEPREHRPVYFAGAWYDTPIYDRAGFHPGMAFDGPAIVEQTDTTAVIEPGMAARVDGFGNILVEMA